MRSKKKKRVALPRVTLIAYSPRDLLAFTEAVNKLGALVNDLKTYTDKLPKPRVKKPAQPAVAEAVTANLFE